MENIFIQLKSFCMGIAAWILPACLLPYVSMLINIAAIFALGVIAMMYMTWLERKLIGRIQDRYGPNRVGKFGLLQPVADAIKMLFKEDIVPSGADKVLHFWAPILVVTAGLLLLAVIPFGKNMVGVDMNVGLFFFLAVGSIHCIPIFMGGWGSHNKFSLLGALRAVAHIVSYEVPMAVCVIAVMLAAGSLSTVQIVTEQSGQYGLSWYVFTPWGLLGFLLFFISGLAQINRCPFDLPEGESELVAGFHTEYSGMKFALFFMGEYLNTFAIAAITVTLFLGGYNGPFFPSWIWFFAKTGVMICVIMWVRGTLPRLRIDQLMALAWKFLLPLSMINVLAEALWVLLPQFAAWPLTAVLTAGGWLLFSNVKLSENTISS